MAKVPLAGTELHPRRDRGAHARRDRAAARALPRQPDRRRCRRSPASVAAPTGRRAHEAASPRRAGPSTPSTSRAGASPTRRTWALIEDVDLLAATPGEDINWLEDIQLLRGGGRPGRLRPLLELVPEDLLPDPRGARGRDRAQGADQAPAVRQLLRHPAQGEAHEVRPARARALGPGSRTVGTDWKPPVLEGWEPPLH